MSNRLLFFALGITLLSYGQSLHLRSGETREWRSFPVDSLGKTTTVEVQSTANSTEYSLILRQRDVKKTNWTVAVNGTKLGVLEADERDMIRVLAIPNGVLRTGANSVQIGNEGQGFSDDIEISDIRIKPVSVSQLLAEATVSISVLSDNKPAPVRLTIVDANGSLMPFSTLRTEAYEAKRTGVLYSADGAARIGLPEGEYRVFASRGFEYNAPSHRVRLRKGDVRNTHLRLRREVNLPGFISCDTHVHTFEFSRHGDASVDERVLTAAGEGLDLVVTTEHNRVEDYAPAITRRNLDDWTSSAPGNEVTTAMGHFNVFPARLGTPQPDPQNKDWSSLMEANWKTESVQIVVQNHPRDLHSNYRPFDSAHHLSSVGVNLNGRPIRANAMEVVNSGAMSSDVMQLVRDWLGLLTRGLPVAAVGSSDTHTVDFVPIGQARTYINVDELKSSWRSDLQGVFRSLAEGRNLVSYGLATELRAADSVKSNGSSVDVPVEVSIHGPSWSAADHVRIYSNGRIVWEDSFSPNRRPGVKLQRKVTLKLPGHDTALVAVATGPGVLQPFWEVRKPYQATSDEWTPLVIGVSNAVWIDGDNDGRRSAPFAYAEKLVEKSSLDAARLAQSLEGYDSSVALQALDILRAQGIRLEDSQVAGAFQNPALKNTYEQYISERRQLRQH